jgi:hypothetical protein
MTLLGRAPREVYRVYGEEEFLEGVDLVDGHRPRARAEESCRAMPAVPRPGERRLRRLAGATLLVGAVGSAGALSAVSGLLSTRGAGRRLGGSLRASVAAAGGLSVGSHPSRGRIGRARSMARSRRELRPARQLQPRHRAAGVRRPASPQGAGRASLELPAQAPQHAYEAPVSEGRSAAIASVPAGARRPPHVEFGFER